MPNHKSCAKRVKTSQKQRLRNRASRSVLRTAVRDLQAMSNKEEASVKYKEVVSLIDRAAADHLIHKNNAGRNKSRLARRIQNMA